MAGIEPASERIDPRKSTSVAGRVRHRRILVRLKHPVVSRYVFRACSGVVRGTPRLSRPGQSLAELGAGGRGLIYETVLPDPCLRSEGHSSI